MVEIVTNEQLVSLGGLLHDIGKLLNRSNHYSKKSNLGKKHPHLSSWFIDYLFENEIIKKNNYLKEIVQKHHEGPHYSDEINYKTVPDTDTKDLKKLALIVTRADNYSSSERGGENDETKFGSRNFRSVPLDSIFSRITLVNEGIEKREHRYKISEFSKENIFSAKREENDQRELDDVISKFLEEIKSIDTDDFQVLFINLLDLIHKYLWALASDTQKEICDISLYDHLKTTSAISLASYLYHVETKGYLKDVRLEEIKKDKENSNFLLIGGDISGIQKYIYALETTSGIAKRLRARSFFIKLLSDVSSYKFINELGLTKANIIISSGGKFYILAQNTSVSVEAINKIKKDINDTLYKDYSGELFLNLEYISLCGEDLGSKFCEKYDELNDKLDHGKNHKFENNILNNPILENELYAGGDNVELCKICGKELVLTKEFSDEKINEDNEKIQCFKCKLDYEIGSILPKMEAIAFYEGQDKNKKGSINLFGIECKIIKKGEDIKGEPFIVHYYKTNANRKFPVIRDVYGGYAPLNSKGEIKTFEEIANESKSKNLGIIKGDVDNLGLIFSLGMKNKDGLDEDNISVSRISTLSRMMDNFFSYWVPEILKEKSETYGSNYIVYAGGDDFMIVGPWDKSIETAKFINQKFREYVGGNDDITLTCGISISKAKEPIYFSSIKATEAEEIGKTSGKNGLVIFGNYIPWEDYHKVFTFANFINENFKSEEETEVKGIYSQSFLYRLLRYTEMAEKYFETKNSKYLKYISDFTYDLSRNIVPRLEKEYKEKYKNEEDVRKYILTDRRITELSKYFGIESLSKKEDKDFLRKYMRVILNYVVRLNRNNGNNKGGEINV